MRPYPGAVFGRDKKPAPAATDSRPAEAAPGASTPTPKPGGKGRATPTRREAEQRNRRPLIGAAPLPKGATRAERKADRAKRQAAVREERTRSRAAMMSGDERFLPAKDKGPVRRFARDYVDSRRNVGEYFLPIALITLLVGVVNIPIARLISLVVLYVMVIVIAVDSFLLRRRVQAKADAKFHGKDTAGVGTYAMMRALQFRRGRMPKPQVGRGQWPSGS
jgi:Protein of unknown function (DUF3043)